MKIRTRFILAFLAVIAIFLVAAAVSMWNLRQLTHIVEFMASESLPMVVAVEEMDVARSEVQQFLTDVSATHESDGYKDAETAYQKFLQRSGKVQKSLQDAGDNVAAQQLTVIESDFKAFYALGVKMAQTYVAQGMDAGNRIMKGDGGQRGFDDLSEKLSGRLDAFKEQQLRKADEIAQGATVQAARMEAILLGSVLVASLFGIVLGTWMAAAMKAQLGGEPSDAVRMARRVGGGDLQADVHDLPVPPDSLMGGLTTMRRDLSAMVTQVRQVSHHVADAATEINSGNQDLSARTASQASALEQAALAMDQMSGSVETNSQHAREAAHMAQSASEVAEHGRVVMGQVVSNMERMDQASRKIADIIGVIDGIAFQTNILALNAAVEAARAGEQGRGFAVVATEVRALAGRSADAAREIKALISATVAQVQEGSGLVQDADQTIRNVVTTIQRVAELVSHFSDSSHQQAQDVGVMGHTVKELDHATEQNAALVEEMSSVTAMLADQAQALVQLVNQFKTDAAA